MVQLSATEFDIVMSSRHENMATTHTKLFTSFFYIKYFKMFFARCGQYVRPAT